jgi:hypothetical protein
MRAVNAVALHALRTACTEHNATGQALQQAGIALTVRDPLRQSYLQCAARLFVMSKLVHSLAETLERTGEALELHQRPAEMAPDPACAVARGLVDPAEWGA